MSKIYIETDMTEMPKGCGECRQIQYCKMYQKQLATAFSGKTNFDKVDAAFYTRPEWCPLKQGMLVDDDELSIGGTGEL